MRADLLPAPFALAAAVAAFLAFPGAGTAAGQEREVLTKRISVGGDEASLRLEFDRGEPLDISFTGGSVLLDGTVVGAASPALDSAWHALLAGVVPLEHDALVRALRDWSPGGGLEGEGLELAVRLRGALDEALRGYATPPPTGSGGDRDREALRALLERQGRLGELAGAVDGLRLDDVRLHVGERVEVGEGEALAATLVVVDGDLVVRGLVDGDVLLVGGTVRLEEGGRVTGDVRLSDAVLQREGGELLGEVRETAAPPAQAPDAALQDRIREEILRELRSELGVGAPAASSPQGSFLAPLQHVGRGVAGVLSHLLAILMLSLVGAAVLHFAHDNLEVVAAAARRAPARAGAVGLAGTFLAIPVWVLGTVALAITFIGIPLMLVWLPAFPVALALAAGLGYYAVARNVGAWLARQRYPYLGWIRLSNPVTLVAGGVLGLGAAFILSHVMQIGGPWLGVLRTLFLVGGILVTAAAVLVGFGAVLITRGGRRHEFYAGDGYYGTGWDDDDFGVPGAGGPRPGTPREGGPAERGPSGSASGSGSPAEAWTDEPRDPEGRQP